MSKENAVRKNTEKTETPAASSAVVPAAAPAAPAVIPPKLSREEIIKLAMVRPDIFENAKVGETFGGSYTRLELQPGEVSKPLVYLKDAKVPIEKEEMVNGVKVTTTEMKRMQVLQVADGSENTLYSTPISSIFQKHWDEAQIKENDVIWIKRYPDAEKKRGLGKGNKMQVFAINVLVRAEPTPA